MTASDWARVVGTAVVAGLPAFFIFSDDCLEKKHYWVWGGAGLIWFCACVVGFVGLIGFIWTV